MLEKVLEDDDEGEAIPLPSVKKETLEKVIEYWTYINTHEAPAFNDKPIKSKNLADVQEEWYVKFVDI